MLPFQKKLTRKTKYGVFRHINGVSIQGHYYAFCNPQEIVPASEYVEMEVYPFSDNAKEVCRKVLHQYDNQSGGYSYVPVDLIQKMLDTLEENNE